VSGTASGGSVLDRILARTRERVAALAAIRPLAEVRAAAERGPARRPFAAALARKDRVNVVAEHKRRSPSRGRIREDLSPADVACHYAAAGAAALSVLTEPESFGGRLEHLVEARASVPLPVLRKDFVVGEWQLWEARAAGADAALLIVAALPGGELRQLLATAREAGLEALVEVHDRAELDHALAAGATLVGVNNRDLRTLEVRLETSLALVPAIPDEVVAVAESGLRTGEDLRRLRDAGFDAFLVGESLMASPDPGAALRGMIEAAEVRS
jgi:indole-3-glycerol phosphate synthase